MILNNLKCKLVPPFVPPYIHLYLFQLMIKYNFELRKDKVNQDGLMPIRILFRIDSSIIKRNTGLSCKINDWQNNRVKANSKKDTYYGYDEINEKLQQILSTFTDNDQHEFVNYRNQTDANEFSKEGDSTTVTNITNDVEEPKKDKIKW